MTGTHGGSTALWSLPTPDLRLDGDPEGPPLMEQGCTLGKGASAAQWGTKGFTRVIRPGWEECRRSRRRLTGLLCSASGGAGLLDRRPTLPSRPAHSAPVELVRRTCRSADPGLRPAGSSVSDHRQNPPRPAGRHNAADHRSSPLSLLRGGCGCSVAGEGEATARRTQGHSRRSGSPWSPTTYRRYCERSLGASRGVGPLRRPRGWSRQRLRALATG